MSLASSHAPGGTEDPRRRAPPISAMLAYAAMLPLVAGALWVVFGEEDSGVILGLTIAWSGAVLCFLAGVRRGLSFRQEGGPTWAQLVTMLGLFVLGAGSLLSPWAWVSLMLQLAGYAAMAVLDPAAADRHETPRYFRRLRPVQMLLPVGSILLMLASLGS